ncbi:hypothetical protein AB3S75_042873 [Citrus x aurantiifolia]
MDSSVAVAPIATENGVEHTENKVSHHKISSKGGWNAAIFIIMVEMAQRFAYYGLAGNLIQYLTNVLNEPTATAAQDVNNWVGISSIFPLLGAFVADSYLGRFNTILLSSFIYFMGMVLLSLAVSVIPLHYRKAVFFTALYILAVGEGGHKPCVQTFAADQFDERNPTDKDAKSSFFNWWYLGIVFGASAAVLVAIYLQDNVGWAVGFGVMAGALALALAIFLIGIKRYRKQAPVGSPFTTVAQVFVAAARKWRVSETQGGGRGIYHGHELDDDDKRTDIGQSKRTIARTNQLRFLDKAMIIDEIDLASRERNPWRLCSLNQVEEVKLVIRLIPIWLSCLMFSCILVQLHTFFTKQGSTMRRSIGSNFQVPPASLQSLVGLSILVAVPVYERIFVPLARRITGHRSGITMLQRIGIGLFTSILTMIVAALVEAKRVRTARENGLIDSPKAIVPISIWWLLPQYLLVSICDVFGIVGLQELFYDQMPEAMRSIGAAAYISIIGVGSFINTGVIEVVEAITHRSWLVDNLNRAHLDYFYWVLAGLSALNLCVFIWIAKRFVYKKVLEDESKEEVC